MSISRECFIFCFCSSSAYSYIIFGVAINTMISLEPEHAAWALFSLSFLDSYASTLGSVLVRVYLNRVKGFAQN